MSQRSVRANILKVLYNLEIKPAPINQTIENVSTVPKEDEKSKVYEYVNGIQDSLSSIDLKISGKLKGWKFEDLNIIERLILRIAAYEMINNLCDRAIIINEAVRLAKIYADPKAAALINGVLDKI